MALPLSKTRPKKKHKNKTETFFVSLQFNFAVGET